MERKIIKIGNSLGLIIPSVCLEEMDITQGDSVELEYDKELGIIVIRNKKTTPKLNYLEEVIKGVVDNHLKEKGL